MLKKLICFICLFAFMAPHVIAEQLFQTTRSNGQSSICGLRAGTWVSGKLQRGDFVSNKVTIKRLRQTIKGLEPGRKRTRMQRRLQSLRQTRAEGDMLCKFGPPESAPSPPTPTPAPGSTPTPLPNYNNFNGYDVTPWGKSQFGIPQWLSANVQRGLQVWTNNCNQGCHTPPTNLPFGTVRARISADPMSFPSSGPGAITDPMLADLVAFINQTQTP